MPSPINSTGAPLAPETVCGKLGPYVWADELYMVAFVTVAQGVGFLSESDTSDLAVWRSADEGASWNQVSSAVEVAGPLDANAVGSSLTFGCCQSIGGEYLYVAYVNSSSTVAVARFNFALGDFDDSNTGPTIGDVGGATSTRIFIEQATTGELGLIVNFSLSFDDQDEVSVLTLTEDLATFGGITLVSGQDSSVPNLGLGIARGLDGRIHGFLYESGSGFAAKKIRHFIVNGAAVAATVATFATELATCAGGTVVGMIDGTIAVMFQVRDGSVWDLKAAVSPSSELPGWVIATIAEDTSGGYSGCLVEQNEQLCAIWNRFTDSDVVLSQYNSATETWGGDEVLF
jgi:hypothetical protein